MKQTDSNFALNMATILAIAALFVLLLVTTAKAGSEADGSAGKSFYPTQSGAGDFQRHCAACHGLNARGNGPVGPTLIRHPADLTLLAARNEGNFPVERVFWVIDGRGEVKVHGPREMPVWGYEFSRAATGLEMTAEAEARIRAIIEYLKGIQRQAD